MPAYSFKEQFVPFVKDGSKPGTIRAARNHAPAVGQLAHLYYGMRTRACTKLVEPSPPIRSVQGIFISENAEVFLMDTVITKENEADLLKEMVSIPANGPLRKPEACLGVKLTWLSADDKDELAWADGFRRPAGKGCFAYMLVFWMQTNKLPFIGNYIKWKE